MGTRGAAPGEQLPQGNLVRMPPAFPRGKRVGAARIPQGNPHPPGEPVSAARIPQGNPHLGADRLPLGNLNGFESGEGAESALLIRWRTCSN